MTEPMTGRRIEFEIPLVPVPLERARTDRIRTKTGKTITVTHKSKRQKIVEEQLMAFLVQHKPENLINGPIWFGLKVHLPIPMSWPKYRQKAAIDGKIRPEGRIDLDNCMKQICDRMNGFYFKDDRQIVEYLPGTGKYYSVRPRWEVVIEW